MQSNSTEMIYLKIMENEITSTSNTENYLERNFIVSRKHVLNLRIETEWINTSREQFTFL